MEELGRIMELADFKKMNEIRARVDATVRDPKTADALKPWYRQFCKRPTFSDDYLPTFNRPNVTLVDTEGRGVDEINERGVVVKGVEYEVDCIVFATGFEVGTAYTRRAGFEVHGRHGVSLTDYWAGGLKTLHGFYSAGFPNCFHMGVTQNAVTANFPHMLDEQAAHITDLILRAAERQSRILEPTPEGEQAWVATVRAKAGANLQFRLDCTPGYYNGEGKPGQGGLLDELYGPGPAEFYGLVRAWRAEGGFEGLRMA
jgi:cation diffusion facilitator CzcD-associated flavoprotein CzcO